MEEEGGDEKEWWDKDEEGGYTSECDCVDLDWDHEVQEREIGYTGKKKSAIGCIPDREKEGGVGDVEQQKNKEDAGNEPYNEERGGKKKGSTKRTLCGIVLFKLNIFLVMFLQVPSIDSTRFPCT